MHIKGKTTNLLFPTLQWIVPIIGICFIEIIKLHPIWIEHYYSNIWYNKIASFQRTITGWVQFSVGDIFYIVLILIFIIKLFRAIFTLIKKFSGKIFVNQLGFLVRKLMWLYIVFFFLWGLNYFRIGISNQLQLSKTHYCKEEVVVLTHQLINKANEYRTQIPDTGLPHMPIQQIIAEAKKCYDSASKQYYFLSYNPISVKSSLYSKMGMYFGFIGYYNPFSGEAQFRNDIPEVLLPYIICHEIAHQLGYASESEANFAGYLACSISELPFFKYSVYLDFFSYAQQEEINTFLIDGDTTGLKQELIYNKEHLNEKVIRDRKAVKQFFYNEENSISPVMSSMYNQYLKFNLQNEGIESYNEVIGWLIAYLREYGKW